MYYILVSVKKKLFNAMLFLNHVHGYDGEEFVVFLEKLVILLEDLE